MSNRALTLIANHTHERTHVRFLKGASGHILRPGSIHMRALLNTTAFFTPWHDTQTNLHNRKPITNPTSIHWTVGAVRGQHGWNFPCPLHLSPNWPTNVNYSWKYSLTHTHPRLQPWPHCKHTNTFKGYARRKPQEEQTKTKSSKRTHEIFIYAHWTWLLSALFNPTDNAVERGGQAGVRASKYAWTDPGLHRVTRRS